MELEWIRTLLIVLTIICASNAFLFIGWFFKYSNKPIQPFEAVAIIASMLTVVTAICVLYIGS